MSLSHPRIHGIVLAGGRSTRMGTDKALLPVHGVPLLRHIIDTLSPYCDGITIVAPCGQPGRYRELLPASTRITCDRMPDQGPLAGIHAALLAMPDDCEYGFFMACDMPVFSPDLFERMSRAITEAEGNADAALCFGQPFHALYRRSAAVIAERLLKERRRRLSAFIDALQAVYVEPPLDDCFLNLNSPDDYAAFKAAVNRGEI